MKMRDNNITPKEFYTQIAKWMDVKQVATAQKWWEAILEVIVRECFYNEKCYVPNLGNFTLTYQEEYVQKQIHGNEEKFYKVPGHYSVNFSPCDAFINDVNGQGITKAYRKRLKKKELTQRDIERQIRFEQMKRLPTETMQSDAKKNLQDLFNKKKGLKDIDGEDGE